MITRTPSQINLHTLTYTTPATPTARARLGPSVGPAPLEVSVARRSLAFYDVVAQHMAQGER